MRTRQHLYYLPGAQTARGCVRKTYDSSHQPCAHSCFNNLHLKANSLALLASSFATPLAELRHASHPPQHRPRQLSTGLIAAVTAAPGHSSNERFPRGTQSYEYSLRQ